MAEITRKMQLTAYLTCEAAMSLIQAGCYSETKEQLIRYRLRSINTTRTEGTNQDLAVELNKLRNLTGIQLFINAEKLDQS